MQRLLTDCKFGLGPLKGLSNLEFFSSLNTEPLDSHWPLPLLLVTTKGLFRSSAFLHTDPWAAAAASTMSCPRRPFSGSPEENLLSIWQDSYLLPAGAMPSRAQWALDTMAFTDWKCLGGQSRTGILWRSQDVGNVVLAAVKAVLGRNRAVAMGTVRGGKAHDERLSGRFGPSPPNGSGRFPWQQVARRRPQSA